MAKPRSGSISEPGISSLTASYVGGPGRLIKNRAEDCRSWAAGEFKWAQEEPQMTMLGGNSAVFGDNDGSSGDPSWKFSHSFSWVVPDLW